MFLGGGWSKVSFGIRQTTGKVRSRGTAFPGTIGTRTTG